MTEESGFRITPRPLVVSLDLELAALSGATLGAQLLANLHARKELDEEQERDAPTGVYSVLALVRERISLLRRVIREEEDPAHLWAPHNSVEDPETSGEYPGDIVLFSWGSHRLPLAMWGNRRMETQGAPKKRAGKGHRGTREKAREAAPESSGVSQGESPREPAPSAPTSSDPGHQNN